MSISAQAIIELAEADLGRSETTGANRSPWLDPIQRRVSAAHGWSPEWLVGQPWCGTWLWHIYDRAGLARSLNPAHPSCETMWVRAQQAGALTSTPQPGDAILWRGVHTGLVVAVGNGVVHTIEGNSSDAVRRRVRAISGTHRFVRPAGVVQGAVERTVTEYWLEDLRPGNTVLGPWRVKAWRDRAYRDLRPERKRISTPVTTGKGLHAIRVGPPRHYGPWATDASRRKAQGVLEKRLGRRLRAHNRTRRAAASALPAGAPEALGKTT